MPRHAGLTPAIILALHAWLPASSVIAQAPVNLNEMRDAALERTNVSRSEAGLPALTRSEILDEAAQSHAADMLERGYHAHVSPEGETPFDRFLAAGGNSWAVSGENIGTCSGCSAPPGLNRVDAFHDGWMQSPGHRENILSQDFDSFGFGIVGEGSIVYAAQTFSGPGAEGGDALSPAEVTELAVDQINAARADAGLDPLDHSEDLDLVAVRVLEHLAQGADELPDNIFALLPEDSMGWTSLSLQSATVGGAGASVGRQALAAIITDWEDAGGAQGPGGTNASHLGFAAEASGDGRLSAVVVFAGR